MRRYRIEHDRDKQTIGDNHWNLYEVDTSDPHAERVSVGWGSWETCAAHAEGLIELRQLTGLMPR